MSEERCEGRHPDFKVQCGRQSDHGPDHIGNHQVDGFAHTVYWSDPDEE